MIVGTTQLFIEFCVEDRKDVLVNYGKSKFDFSCLGGTDSTKHLNEVDLLEQLIKKDRPRRLPAKPPVTSLQLRSPQPPVTSLQLRSAQEPSFSIPQHISDPTSTGR
ncbi:hypothetical protein AAFF_G00057990 [Aldrovandia affinis]|uniref:Uncharacterized protein n=1 Tax=Aldrovandia affinis TaxID=143900 RepID=A0AAD7VXI7_9TELE|nr:hypothetical protein AAFF_G00057990 [Aldrovandia affinis]